VRIVPFERIFQPHERDNRLQTALKAEADGILRWAVEGYQLYKLEGLEPTSKMLDYLEEYMTNEDPVAQFVDTYLDTGTEQDFVPVQTMLDAVKEYCHRQGLDYPSETLVRKRLRELLGATVQRRCGQHQERTRGFVGYIVLNDREDDNPF
jgi:putative DNA primase/helicase